MTTTRAQAPGFIRGVERAGCRTRHAILSSVAHRYRLYPVPRHIDILSMHCAHTRQVWNMALEQANLYRPHWGPTPNSAERSRQLAEARKDSWLGDGSSSVQQQALRDFDQALKNWWGGSHRRPTWRSFHKGHRSFKVRDVTVTKQARHLRADLRARRAAPPVARVELFTDTTGDHHWRAIARNGEIVATCGEGYRNAAHARAMAERILPGVEIRDEETNRG